MTTQLARSAPTGAHFAPVDAEPRAERADPFRRHVLDHGISPWTARGLVALATFLNLGLALYDVSSRSLWIDEGFTWLISAQPVPALWRMSGAQGGHLFGYYLVLHFATSWFGDSPVVLRMPSVLAGAATVPLVYALASRMALKRLAGVFAAGLFAVSLPLVFWQQNARDYSFVVFLAVATTLLLVQAVQTGRAWRLVAWGILSALAFYTHPELAYLTPVHVVAFLVWARSRAQRWAMVGVTAAAVAGSIPVLLNALNNPNYSTSINPAPNWRTTREIVTFLASGAGSPVPYRKPETALVYVTAAICAIGLGLLLGDLVRHRRADTTFGPALALAWLVAPLLISWGVSETGRSTFLDRYLILSLPAAAIVMALALARARPRVLGYFGVLYLLIFRFAVIPPAYGVPLEDWISPTDLILADARAGDCVTFVDSKVRLLYDYYVFRQDALADPSSTQPIQAFPPVLPGGPGAIFYAVNLPPTYISQWQTLHAVVGTRYFCARVWLVTSHAGSSGGNASSRQRYTALQLFRDNLTARYRPGPSYRFVGVDVQLYTGVPIPRA